LGRMIAFFIPGIPVQLAVLCMAAAINVAITRTAIATTLILCYLSGEQCALSAVLASSLVSLFCTGYMVSTFCLLPEKYFPCDSFFPLCTNTAIHQNSDCAKRSRE
jgi:hypothetical protein